MTSEKIRVSIQGLPVSNSENAALRLYPDAEITYCTSFVEAINSLGKDLVDLCILPYGNQLAGVVRERVKRDWSPENRNIIAPKKGDIFVIQKFLSELDKYNLLQVEKYSHKLFHCLVAQDNTSFENIKHVYSHPMALLQCGAFLDTYNIEKHHYEDTAASAQMISEKNDPESAAIADIKAAKTYGLKILKKCISDIEPNFTDFVSFTTKDKEHLFF